MTDPCIISVAITGSVPRKRDNSALPVTVSEQIESTHAAFEAGAALVHVHSHRTPGGRLDEDVRTLANFPNRSPKELRVLRRRAVGLPHVDVHHRRPRLARAGATRLDEGDERAGALGFDRFDEAGEGA